MVVIYWIKSTSTPISTNQCPWSQGLFLIGACLFEQYALPLNGLKAVEFQSQVQYQSSLCHYTSNMGNSIVVPDESVYETIDQITINPKPTKKDKNTMIETLIYEMEYVTEQLHKSEAKLKGYKKQNKDLAIMISSLKAKELTQKQEIEHMRIIKCLLSFVQKELPQMETEV